MKHTFPHMQLEEIFGKWTNCPNMVACASGTAALHLALEALQLPPNSEVLVPEYTMVACARAVRMANLTPVFVDCTDNLLMDVGLLEDKITRRTKAIMPVHIYGRRCDMDAIADFAKFEGLKIIEDLAEAHGVEVHPETDAACWSFYRNKIIHGEEGGAVAFKDPRKAEFAKRLRSLGFDEDQSCLHAARGVNARMSSAHAELILPSLKEAQVNIAIRACIEDYYSRRIPVQWQMPRRDVVWVYDIRIPELSEVKQDILVKMLKKGSVDRRGMHARHGFKPMSMQPEFFNGSFVKLNAYRQAYKVIYLPVNPDMMEEDVKANVDSLLQCVREILPAASPR